MCSLKVAATWAHEVNGHGVPTAMPSWAESGHGPLVPPEARNANKSCFVNKQETENGDSYVADSLGGRPGS